MSATLNLGDGNWATKEDSLLAYNSENNNYKPLPFDFSRGSSATVVNKDGLIEEVGSGQARIDFKDNTKGALLLEPSRTNSLLQSNQFDTTWTSTNATVASGQIGVGGSSDAWLLSKSSIGGRINQSISLNGVQTTSIYAKADTSNWIAFTSGGSKTAYFDLKNGVLGTISGTAISSKIESVGNGWYRCSLTQDVTLTQIRVYVAEGDLDVTGTSGSIYIQNAQLEQGSYPTSYIPTSGEANGVTRLADSCNNDFSVISTVANTNTVVLKFIPMGFDVDFAELLRFSDGTDEISLEGFSTNNYDMYGSGLTSSGMVDGALSLDAGSINTISFSYSGTSLRFSHNGSTINTTTPTGNLPTITEVSHSVGVLSPIKILDLRVYNDFKTQEELNTLTI